MSTQRTAIVTGANKGIGLAVVRQLALQFPSSQLATSGSSLLIYLTARSQTRGEEALASLHSDSQFQATKATVKYAALDISSSSSIESFAAKIKQEHPEGVDIVINNAAIAMNGFDEQVVKETLGSNYFGTLETTRHLLPLLRENGRLVNVASMAGHLTGKYSSAVRERLVNAKSGSDVTTLMKEFMADPYSGNFPQAAYAVSKCGVIAWTKVLAQEEQKKGRGVLVNACCPGFVRTTMTRGAGHKTVDEGAMTPVMLALADLKGRTGGFWQHEKEIEW